MYIWKAKIIGCFCGFQELFRSISRNDETRARAEWRIVICRIFVHWNHPSSFTFHNGFILKRMSLTKYFLAKKSDWWSCYHLVKRGRKIWPDSNLESNETVFCNSVLLTSISSLTITRYFALEQNCAIQCRILRAFQVQFHLSSLMLTYPGSKLWW